MPPFDEVSTDFPTPPIWVEIVAYFGHIPLYSGAQRHWRTRAKLAVRGNPSAPQIGLFLPGTHIVADLPSSPDHYVEIDEAFFELRTALSKLQIIPYNESDCSGQLRYVQCLIERESHKVQLALVANGEESLPAIEATVDYFASLKNH